MLNALDSQNSNLKLGLFPFVNKLQSRLKPQSRQIRDKIFKLHKNVILIKKIIPRKNDNGSNKFSQRISRIDAFSTI